ncbi:MAG: A/G-specific adenine glycosylase [Gemmatimonadaceae bacterium]|nr:A/G-specific adenine glycosylase [Gemmatimonadaceae bacterium]
MAARRKRPGGPRLDPAGLADFGTRLRRWYRRRARDLPWRRTDDPYHILVSELMLQQTQVSRVIDFYARFLTRFPSLETLAAARESHVLAAWEGLGYYARARNLHKLAQRVTRDGSAAWGEDAAIASGSRRAAESDAGSNAARATLPSDPEHLRRLPGIGAYTAGAVASFAFYRRTPLVDTNVARVLTRYFAPRLHPKRARDQKAIWAIAEASLPRTGKATWTHNQALMEIGALVCTARVKKCGECPVRRGCRSAEE